MAARIKVLGFADGTELKTAMWVADFNVDSPPHELRSYFTAEGAVVNGVHGGRIELTIHPDDARRFADSGDAMLAWNKQSRVRPYRPDGRPNKPLTALTVEVEPC